MYFSIFVIFFPVYKVSQTKLQKDSSFKKNLSILFQGSELIEGSVFGRSGQPFLNAQPSVLDKQEFVSDKDFAQTK